MEMQTTSVSTSQHVRQDGEGSLVPQAFSPTAALQKPSVVVNVPGTDKMQRNEAPKPADETGVAVNAAMCGQKRSLADPSLPSEVLWEQMGKETANNEMTPHLNDLTLSGTEGSEASTRGTEEDNLTKCCQDSSLKAAALEPVFAGSQTQAPRDAAEDAFADVENVENGIEQKTGKEEAQKVDSDRQATASPDLEQLEERLAALMRDEALGGEERTEGWLVHSVSAPLRSERTFSPRSEESPPPSSDASPESSSEGGPWSVNDEGGGVGFGEEMGWEERAIEEEMSAEELELYAELADSAAALAAARQQELLAWRRGGGKWRAQQERRKRGEGRAERREGEEGGEGEREEGGFLIGLDTGVLSARQRIECEMQNTDGSMRQTRKLEALREESWEGPGSPLHGATRRDRKSVV